LFRLVVRILKGIKMDLVLPLKGEYFDAIKAGTKTEENRLCTPYWKKRIEGRRYEHVILTRGYPKRDDHARRLVLPWKGWTMKVITHPHFGPNRVSVYAINVARETCTYPRCTCPFDAPADPNWCARGLPHSSN